MGRKARWGRTICAREWDAAHESPLSEWYSGWGGEQVCKYSNVVLKGNVVEGKESGLFVEYDEDGSEVWSGYYLHGKRHSELKKSKGMAGFYEERDRSGIVVCVSHFGPVRLCKDGLS